MNAEATLRILQKSLNHIARGKVYYGPQGMERRVFRCCDDNPDCTSQERCCELYSKFVNATNVKAAPSARQPAVRESVIETYKFHGLKNINYGIPMRM